MDSGDSFEVEDRAIGSPGIARGERNGWIVQSSRLEGVTRAT